MYEYFQKYFMAARLTILLACFLEIILASRIYCQANQTIVSTQNQVDELSPEWIKHYASNGIQSQSTPIDIVVDNIGNSYILLTNETTFTSSDYVVIKYDVDGNKIWENRYDGPSHYEDKPIAICVDSYNNVYVTGTSYGNNNTKDICTIKYNPEGELLWEQRFESVANSIDEAGKMIVTKEGDVIVTGTTQPSGQRTEMVTLKYNSSGSTLWWKTFSSGGAITYPYNLSIDENGNILVNSGSSLDLQYVVKYSATGTELWNKYITVAIYNTLLLTGENNTFYVAGTGIEWGSIPVNIFLSKYSPEGNLIWKILLRKYSYNNFISMKRDSAGAIYVLGQTEQITQAGTYRNSLTVKCDPNGDIIWERVYGPNTGNGSLSPLSLAIDKLNNVYISSDSLVNGSYFGKNLIKYSSTGDLRWSKIITTITNSKNIVIGNNNSINLLSNVINSGNTICSISNFDSTGIENWTTKYKSFTGNSLDNVIGSTFSNNKLYVVGNSKGNLSGIGKDFFLLAYDKTGNNLWATNYSQNSNEEYPKALIHDKEGNLLITGYEVTSNGNNVITIKFNSQGQLLWNAKYSVAQNSDNYSNSIIVDDADNIYTTGNTMFDRGRYLTLKYDKNGNNLWVMQEPISWTDWPVANDIAIDSQNNIFVTGSLLKAKTEGDPKTYRQIATVKYSESGERKWISFFDREGKSSIGNKIVTDSADNIYVVGTSDKSIVVIKYDNIGKEVWTKEIDTQAYATTIAGIRLNYQGDLVVAGSAYINNKVQYFAAKYNTSAGNVYWFTTFHFSDIYQNENNTASAMQLDAKGNIYIIGTSAYSYCTLVKITNDGLVESTSKYPYETTSGLQTKSAGKAIVLDEAGNIYVSAVSTISSSNVVTVIKYKQTGTGIEENQDPMPYNFSLSQNYPNPFNPETTISFSVPKSEHVTLKIYDLLGREVATLVNEFKQAGTYNSRLNTQNYKLPSGVYFYRLKAGSYSETKKLILMK